MGIKATIVDGQVYANYTPDNTSTDTRGTSNMGKDQFLQILAAEMQYQDPLEPSSNTEWVSQMATFSQIEELQNVSGSVEKGQIQDLVGRIVIMATTDSSGETNYISGKVDSIEMKDGEIFLSIDGYLYNAKDLYSVVDDDYYNDLIEEAQKG